MPVALADSVVQPRKTMASSFRSFLIGLILHMAVADDMSMLKADDECDAGDAECSLNALQAKVQLRSHSDEEVNSSYPANPGWNCYDPKYSSNSGYQGQMSVSTCSARCAGTGWCVGFQYMGCQSKCWLRSGGEGTCSHSNHGEAACFTYYGHIKHR